jgi:hypothetical protein
MALTVYHRVFREDRFFNFCNRMEKSHGKGYEIYPLV